MQFSKELSAFLDSHGTSRSGLNSGPVFGYDTVHPLEQQTTIKNNPSKLETNDAYESQRSNSGM